MSNQRYSPEFKDEAVRQVVVRGHSVAEVSDRLKKVGDTNNLTTYRELERIRVGYQRTIDSDFG